MSTEVSEQVTQKSASNLALAFVLLPQRKRSAMSALYAFCRAVDDIADEDANPVETRREQLEAWRKDIQRAYTGNTPELPVNRELKPIIQEFQLPLKYFEELIDGVEMDLTQLRYPDYPALETYCYHVASVVGLLSIEIFGYSDPMCREYANHLGKALQLTNILRDIGNDADRGRIYVPLSELARHGVSPEEILQHRGSARFESLCVSLAGNAREYYGKARASLPPSDRRSMVAAELMGTVYWKLLRVLERGGFPVLAPEPVRLSKARKLSLIAQAWLRVHTGIPFAAYGG